MKKIVTILLVLLTFSLLGIYSYEKNRDESNQAVCKVIELDNSSLISLGKAVIGAQELKVEVRTGINKGELIRVSNNLIGDMEFDEIYKLNDKILVGLVEVSGELIGKPLSLYRDEATMILLFTFIICLLVYAKTTGVYALLSFAGSVAIIWKILVPLLLKGYNPLLITTITLGLLTALIVFSVAGFTKKAYTAFLGTMFGLITTVIITLLFGEIFKLKGMTEPFSQALFFGSGMSLNMKQIFYSAILIGASGAAMDIAMDVAASMEEVIVNRPDMTRRALIKSGFNVGRSVIGTMTTTLLLAYSGSYLTLIMLFYQKETGISQIFNMKIISAEIMRTVIGSIGLVLVAPITALFAGYIYVVSPKKELEVIK